MNYYSDQDIKKLFNNDQKIVFVKNKIYNFTNFDHPGNFDAFFNRVGTDVSNDYAFHGKNAKNVWKKYLIGYKGSNCVIV